jgi:putative pyruvate formate lyase activating enzyme
LSDQGTSASVAVEPGYAGLLRSGELSRRVDRARSHLADCDLCARYCHVNRFEGIRGAVCRTGERAVVHSHGPHHGEEAPLSGWRGSGTIFFSWCSLRCEFCQNWDISQRGVGQEVDAGGLSEIMLALQSRGCHNINLVTPSHVVAQILSAEALALLDGVIDIYMPDMKYGDSATAREFSHVRDYWKVNRAAVREMHRQVGDLVLDERGIARRGLLVRHLVMPGGVSGTETVLRFLAGEVSRNTYVNIMDQYRPCYRAFEHPPLDRPLRRDECAQAIAAAERLGLQRLDEHRARLSL